LFITPVGKLLIISGLKIRFVQIYVLPLYHQARDKKINPESGKFETANHCFFEPNPRNGKSAKMI